MAGERAIPGLQEDGFTTVNRLRAHAATLSAEAFAEIYSVPALVVNTTATNLGDSPGADDGASYAATLVQERATIGEHAEIANYAGRLAFLCKRPGNPFPQVISLGRVRNNDVIVGLQSISKLHAIFTIDGDDWILGDHGSTNGVFVNGERLETRGKQKLEDGALLRFGADLLCTFLLPSSLYTHLHGPGY